MADDDEQPTYIHTQGFTLEDTFFTIQYPVPSGERVGYTTDRNIAKDCKEIFNWRCQSDDIRDTLGERRLKEVKRKSIRAVFDESGEPIPLEIRARSFWITQNEKVDVTGEDRHSVCQLGLYFAWKDEQAKMDSMAQYVVAGMNMTGEQVDLSQKTLKARLLELGLSWDDMKSLIGPGSSLIYSTARPFRRDGSGQAQELGCRASKE